MKMLLTFESRKLYLPPHHPVYRVTVLDETHGAQVRQSWVHIQNSLCEEVLQACMQKAGELSWFAICYPLPSDTVMHHSARL